MNDHRQRRPRPRVRLPLWAALLLGTLASVLAITLLWLSGVWLFTTVREAVAGWSATELELDPRLGDESGDSAGGIRDPLVSSEDPQSAEGSLLSPQMLQPWPGKERVNILLLGIDLRCDEEGPTHTDSMMVLTVDPVGLSAAALSLPRDLWVEIPGFGVNRINQAYFQGDVYDYPGGGAALAVKTVEGALGVPIDYYVAVNFEGFVEFVDLIGGITIEAPETIEDPDYPDSCYGYDPFYIMEGIHELDGTRALKYARTRATAGSDIDRAGRQQQVVMAARDKVMRVNMVPRLLAQAPQLWSSFQKNVRTDMSPEEAIQLALLAQDIPRESIRLAVIDYTYVYNEQTPEGQMVLVPNRERIRALRDQIFTPAAIPTPVIENLPALMRTENARIMLSNGTPVFGLAGNTRDYLDDFGLKIVEIGNAEAATYATTQIIDYGNHPSTTLYLAQLLSVPPLNITYSTRAAAGNYDILVILGNDWELETPVPSTPVP